MIDATADLFVTSETNPNGAMRDVRVGNQIGRRLHNHRHAGLIVRSQQGRAIGSDNGFSSETPQLGTFGDPDDFGVITRKDEVLSVVVTMNDWLDVPSACLRRSIDVSDPGDYGGWIAHVDTSPETCG